MNFRARLVILPLLAGLSFGRPAAEARAGEVVVVLSSDSGPYQEALDGFLAEYGPTAQVLRAGRPDEKTSKDVKVVVAFGGRAASGNYPASATLIYALAPGSLPAHKGRVVYVPLLPQPAQWAASLKRVHQGLRRLAIVWISPTFNLSIGAALPALAEAGIQTVQKRLASPDDLPAALRSLKGNADAFCVAPDPALLTPDTFATAREFAWANDVPFIAPLGGLTASGAAASVSITFSEAGRTAARAARAALAGPVPAVAFGDVAEIVVNITAAEKSGLTFSDELLAQATRVLR